MSAMILQHVKSCYPSLLSAIPKINYISNAASLVAAVRSFASLPQPQAVSSTDLDHIRNIGISAHIDSGKTTLTERILYYTGRIKEIHEVRGKDGIGAKMDSMELEREKGITIKSAATYCMWKGYSVNLIDTPGHVDFTVEVERSLRVLDGAILVLCCVGGVQSQTVTVDKQMKRYDVPRLAFINKLDRAAADPWKVVEQVRRRINPSCAAVQIPIGAEENFRGVVDIIEQRAMFFDGSKGEKVTISDVPAELLGTMEAKRAELIEKVANVDEELGELFLAEEPISSRQLHAAIKRSVQALKFFPIFMGSAYKNKGVQPLLDGVLSYLPNPQQVTNTALDQKKREEKLLLPCDPKGPLVALAFKLEDGKHGQLTYVRVYSGVLKKGTRLLNVNTNQRVQLARLLRTHSDELEDISEAGAGEVVAMFGVNCSSGDTFTDGVVRYSMTSIHVPDPVVSLSVTSKNRDNIENFNKALARFLREDPTFRMEKDQQSGQTIISGMGELHLEIYLERMKREYHVEVATGQPKVNYKETVRKRADFDYLHKKQKGGAGQFGGIRGYIEPIAQEEGKRFEFLNKMIDNSIPHNLIPSVEKGFKESIQSGELIRYPVNGVRVVIEGGKSHPVDSNDVAFRAAAHGAFAEAYMNADPCVLEPIMYMEVRSPNEYQEAVMADLNKRRSVINDTVLENDELAIQCQVALARMFGYSMALRSATAGNAEFSMEYSHHAEVPPDVQEELIEKFATGRHG